MMKKLVIILAIALVGVLMAASAAFALVAPYTHGDFSANSKGCADCHVTHAANAQKLLAGGDGTQAGFCLLCHQNNATGSPFDVVQGKIMADSGFNAGTRTITGSWVDPSVMSYSYSGGFTTAYDWWDTQVLKTVTSMHNVRGSDANFGPNANVSSYQYTAADTIPGSSAIQIDFDCGSCHDPHAGGAYVNDQAGKNPRLLRSVLPKDGTSRWVEMQFDQPSNTVVQYTYGFNGWCGGCHDIFDTTKAGDNRTGYTQTNGRHAYMHKFGIYVDTTKFGGGTNPYLTAYMPLERDPNAGNLTEISCITCHRAHGSSATAQPNVWNRYDTYKSYANVTQATTGSIAQGAGTGSALLRLKQRDVCYKCHAEALYNHSVTHSP
ncbi:MAG: cytochrome c3 family protein [Eubacteriales bacterium]